VAIPSARLPVASPTFTPLPYGLFSVVQSPSTSDRHWMNGVLHQPDACGPAKSTINPCPVVTGLDKSPTATGIGLMGADPFTIYSWIDCGPVGHPSLEMEDRARTALMRGREREVERVFMTGSVSTTGGPLVMPHLAEDNVVFGPSGEVSQLAASPVTTGSSSVDVVEGLGALEGALASCYGGEGVIHVPRAALAHLSNRGMLIRDGSQLRTFSGNLVAAGSGYAGTAPDGSAPPAGFAWLYATGAVTMYEGPARLTSSFADAVDTSENDLVLIAEQTFLLTWDCCLFAANVRLGGFDSGSIGSPD
jgi:hypothetical protein